MSSSSYERVSGKQEILNKLIADRQYYIDYLYLLEKVKFCRKKDGSVFQNINKNFENGKVIVKSYNDSFHPSFQVSGYSESGKYCSYDFDAYLYIDDMLRKNPDDSRVKGEKATDGFWRKTYLLSVSEIGEKIEAEKQFCRDRIENYTRQIEKLEVVFPMVREKLQELKTLISENCRELRENPIFTSGIEYALFDYIRTEIR